MNTAKYRTIEKCRVCGAQNLLSILSLGELYVSDFLDSPDKTKGIKAPLELVLCNVKDGGCGLLQLRHTVSNEAMYRNYWYRSGINKTMTDELNGIADKATTIANLKAQDYVMDIGANDGTLLRGYKLPNLNTVGFEPALNLDSYNRQGTTKIIADFFTQSAWQKEYGETKAKVITAIGMFYDLDDPNVFVADVAKCLDDEGLLVIQMMYLPSFLERNAFDGIAGNQGRQRRAAIAADHGRHPLHHHAFHRRILEHGQMRIRVIGDVNKSRSHIFAGGVDFNFCFEAV